MHFDALFMNGLGGSFNFFNPLRFKCSSLVSMLISYGRDLILGLSLRSREMSVMNVQIHKGTSLKRFLLRLRLISDEAVTFIGREDRQLSERLSSVKAFDQRGILGR